MDRSGGVASAFSTGGGGHDYEAAVGTWLAAALLAGASPLGSAVGLPQAIRLQARASGYRLDDIVVTGSAAGATTVAALSVKSFDMLKGRRLHDEFVEEAWKQILSAEFQEVDYVGFVCDRSALSNVNALDDLVKAARADEAGVSKRILEAGAFNQVHRDLWASARCPENLARHHGIEVEESAARLLARLLPLRLDFLSTVSHSKSQAIGWCQTALLDRGDADAPTALWNAIKAFVDGQIPAGGVITWGTLLRELTPRFEFHLRPDTSHAWNQVRRYSQATREAVRDEVGSGLTFDRTLDLRALEDATTTTRIVLLGGPSGCGKSALAKRWSEERESEAVWLEASALRDGVSAAEQRLGMKTGLHDVLRLSPRPVRLVVDGLDRTYDPTIFAAVAEVARRVAASDASITLVITCQEGELARTSQALLRANCPAPFQHALGNPTLEEVWSLIGHHSDLAKAAAGSPLADLLRSPKVLDLVLQAADSGASIGQAVDESDIAGLWWEHIVGGNSGAAAREAFVLRLAEQQGDALQPSTPEGSISPGDVGPVDGLRRDGVLASPGRGYRFAHELFGDWARFRLLGSASAAGSQAVQGRQDAPAWHRAIQLFALSRLREAGVEAWDADRQELDDAGHALLADLYLDAVIFSPDTSMLLGSLEQSLLAGEGELLRRFLRRFMLVATVPDPRGTLLFDDDPEMALQWAAEVRLPIWPLWPPLLEFLNRVPERAFDAAADEVSVVLDLWLRRTEPRWPARGIAARTAVALGHWVIARSEEGVIFRDGAIDRLYRTVVAASSEFPDEVASMLEKALVHPTNLGNIAAHRTDAGGFEGFGRVDQHLLRAALLEGDTLLPLIERAPERAASLLRAAVLEEPPDRRHGVASLERGRRRHVGITDAPRWRYTIPENGPFSLFLQRDAAIAIETIVRIVEAATERWASGGADSNQTFEALVQGEWLRLVGGSDVARWHRGGPFVPDVLAAALMALEAWIYRSLDNEEDIEEVLGRLLRSRSLAIWGMLTEVAAYQPELTSGVLAPLLTCADLVQCDLQYRLDDHSYLLIGVFDGVLANRVRQWHFMAHRSRSIHDMLIRLALEGNETSVLARQRWLTSDPERLQYLIAKVDPANYVLRVRDDGAAAYEYVPPAHVREGIEEANRESQAVSFWLLGPRKARALLDSDALLSDAELEGLWQELNECWDLPIDQELADAGVRSPADMGCGVAALLVLRYPRWLSRFPDRYAWCREQLLRPFLEPPPRSPFDMPAEPSRDRWEVFCAEALPSLLAADRSDADVRTAVAALAIAPHLISIARLFEGINALGMPEDRARLEQIALLRARHLAWLQEKRHREDRPEFADDWPSVKDLPDVETPLREALADFVDQRGEPPALDLESFLDDTPEGMLGAAMNARRRSTVLVDFDYLLAAFSDLLTSPDQDRAGRERKYRFGTALARNCGRGLQPKPGRSEVSGTPYEFEQHLFGLLGPLVANGTPAEARQIWEPLLAPGYMASHWGYYFLRQVWDTALSAQLPPSGFVAIVAEMLEFASAAITWAGHGPRTDDLDLALVGMDDLTAYKLKAHHASTFGELRPAIVGWVSRILNRWTGKSIAGFMARAAADEIRPDLLGVFKQRFAEGVDPSLDKSVAAALSEISSREPGFLRGSDQASLDARYLLSAAAGRQNPLAAELLNSLR